jgi:glycerophosphoryl diester phosphodiesterase
MRLKTLGKCILLLFVAATCGAQYASAQNKKMHTLNFKNAQELRAFFKYEKNSKIIVSGHRGGNEPGYPENSIEGFKNVLEQMPAMFEIDPRLTKDSVIVLMHDATLDRTTNGKGKVGDYTYKELQAFRLKDHDGNLTDYKIPTLESVIKWSKGKTIVNLDKKDVPAAMYVAMIKRLHAEGHVMITVHTGAQARYYYDRFPNIMMSAFCRNAKEYEDMTFAGVPWSHIIAYVGPNLNKNNENICKELHKKGVRCMISLAPTVDKMKTAEERAVKYAEEIKTNPDIIESDIPTEVWKAMHTSLK